MKREHAVLMVQGNAYRLLHKNWTYCAISKKKKLIEWFNEAEICDSGEKPFTGRNKRAMKSLLRTLLREKPEDYDWFISRKWMKKEGLLPFSDWHVLTP